MTENQPPEFSPEFYGLMLENLQQALFLKDRQGRFLYVNEQFCSMIGRELREVLVSTDADLFPPELAEKYHNDDRLVLSRQEPFEVVEENPDPDGEMRYVQVVKKPLLRHGELIGVQGVFWDVTDKFRAEARSREAEDRFRIVAGATTDTVWDWNLKTNGVWWSEGVLSTWGYSPDQVGKTADWWVSRLHPDDKHRILASVDQALKGDGGHWSAEYRYQAADGSYRSILDRGSIIRDLDGTAIRMIGSELELSERVTAEQALRASEERLRLTLEAAEDAVWDIDFAGGKVWWNPVHETFLGKLPPVPRDVRKWWEERLHPTDAEQVVMDLDRALGDAMTSHWAADYRLRNVAGDYSFVQDRALISRDGSGKVVRIVGTVRDSSKLREEQEERERMSHKLQEAQKLESLGVLAGGIAHDFNNLLTSILGNINLAQIELPLSSAVHAYLDDVEKASIRAADLCKQMLAYSGKGRFVVKRVGLTEIVEEMMQLLQVSISKQAVLKYNLDNNLPAVAADPTQIRQIVMNLVINASEAVDDKSGIISITTGLIRVDEDYLKGTYLAPNIPAGDYVFLEVSDSGCGMDKETRERIFDPFFTTKFTGRGLGLAAVLGIVRGHNGALKVYSESGKGTTFKLLLPCAKGESEDAGAVLIPLAKTRGEGLVLVVDDEETVRATSARMLESAGYTVKIASDGCEGVEAFRESAHEIKLVLLDLTMPHLDGVEAFRAMRQIREDACVMLMSGYNEQEAVQRFTGKGLAGFVQKPFQIQTLLGKVKEALEDA